MQRTPHRAKANTIRLGLLTPARLGATNTLRSTGGSGSLRRVPCDDLTTANPALVPTYLNGSPTKFETTQSAGADRQGDARTIRSRKLPADRRWSCCALRFRPQRPQLNRPVFATVVLGFAINRQIAVFHFQTTVLVDGARCKHVGARPTSMTNVAQPLAQLNKAVSRVHCRLKTRCNAHMSRLVMMVASRYMRRSINAAAVVGKQSSHGNRSPQRHRCISATSSLNRAVRASWSARACGPR